MNRLASNDGWLNLTNHRYEDLRIRRTLAGIPEWRWCLGPGCETGQLHAGGNEEPCMTCHQCGFKQCFVHQQKWHEGFMCDEYDMQRIPNKEEEASEKLIPKITRPCPRCHVKIQKSEGCHHMTCKFLNISVYGKKNRICYADRNDRPILYA